VDEDGAPDFKRVVVQRKSSAIFDVLAAIARDIDKRRDRERKFLRSSPSASSPTATPDEGAGVGA